MFRRIKHQFIAELSWWCWSSAMLLPRPAWQLLLRKVPTALGHAEPWLWWEGWVTLTIGQMVFTPISGMAFLKHLVMKIEAKWQNHGLIKLNESSTWIWFSFQGSLPGFKAHVGEFKAILSLSCPCFSMGSFHLEPWPGGSCGNFRLWCCHDMGKPIHNLLSLEPWKQSQACQKWVEMSWARSLKSGGQKF